MSNTPKHACFYVDTIDTITFCVDDSLFKVPREPFETGSTAFRDMFLLPTGNLDEEGRSDENPIHLAGITRDEFEQLLSVLFHKTAPASIDRLSGVCKISLPETVDQWTSVLKLADLWGFESIRQAAIDHLRDIASPVEKIALAQTFNLDYKSWVYSAYLKIVERETSISIEEAQRMGLETTLELLAIREARAYNRGYWAPKYFDIDMKLEFSGSPNAEISLVVCKTPRVCDQVPPSFKACVVIYRALLGCGRLDEVLVTPSND